MILAFAEVITKNGRFESALDRTFKDRKVLQSQMKTVQVDGRFSTLGFVISDYPVNYFKVNCETDGSLHQVFVGYDLTASYPRNEDEKVISMIAGWLRRVFQETDGYAAKRKELLDIVDSWVQETVKRIASEREGESE
jgi:hypothetical protein